MAPKASASSSKAPVKKRSLKPLKGITKKVIRGGKGKPLGKKKAAASSSSGGRKRLPTAIVHFQDPEVVVWQVGQYLSLIHI